MKAQGNAEGHYFLFPSTGNRATSPTGGSADTGERSHRQRPVDAAHLPLQPEQVHDEEEEEDHEEPQHHHLEELEGGPVRPAPHTVYAQEGDEQCHLPQTQHSMSLPGGGTGTCSSSHDTKKINQRCVAAVTPHDFCKLLIKVM